MVRSSNQRSHRPKQTVQTVQILHGETNSSGGKNHDHQTELLPLRSHFHFLTFSSWETQLDDEVESRIDLRLSLACVQMNNNQPEDR